MSLKHGHLEDVMRKGEQLLTSQVRDLNLEHERLQAKLQTEVMQRKKLHNIIEDMKGKIRVFCRVRPLSQQEQSLKSSSIIKVADEYTLKFRVMQEGK